MSREESGWSSPPGISSIRWGILVAYLMNWRIHLIVQERTLLCVLLLKLWVIERNFGRVRRQVQKLTTASLDTRAYSLLFVRGQIVQNNDLAGT
jgi:hypothetical protein